MSATRRTYDHRIRQVIAASGDITVFSNLDIPRSTRRSWIRRGVPDVVSNEADEIDLRVQIAKLQRRVEVLAAVLRFLMTLVRATNANLVAQRVPAATAKARILRAIARAKPSIGHRSALRVLGLRQSRFREWTRAAERCALQDAPPCPRSVPSRLTYEERSAMRDLVEAESFRHLSVRSLAILARRIGRVYASYETWCRNIRRYKWNRPRNRLYPAKPKVGIRADRPGQYLHVDVTIIRLLDGSRAYLHAVLDNYSRKVLAWALQPKLTANTTRTLVRKALNVVDNAATPVAVVTDGGSENHVLAHLSDIKHLIAQVDIDQSNSLVGALWMSPSYYSFALCLGSKSPGSGFSTLIKSPLHRPRRT